MSPRSQLRIHLTAIALAATTACGSPTTKQHAAPSKPLAPLRVAVAVDAGPAFKEVAAAYERATGERADVTAGRSGELVEQMEAGALYDVYISPKPPEIDRTITMNLCLREPTVVYGIQRIAMWTKPGVEPPKTLTDLVDPKWGKIVMTVGSPYGKIARDVLTRHGAWEKVRAKIVESEGMSDFEVQASKGDVGITALSVALRLPGNHVEVDPNEYERVPAQVVTCKAGNAAPIDAASRFLRFVAGDESRAILRRHGFY